ncbi:MAG: hypothetical protein UY21_C0014G0022 [Microgenomates group bacterium GW2011_GWA1_48_10]|nr:MAG: hypothetical protein UY21_C0014G0022 [Microgenomates group bacterium GW2011_GWA1_48_10]
MLEFMANIGQLRQKNGRLEVVHTINRERVVVPTALEQLGRMVKVDVDGKIVEVDSAQVWELHGAPCEQRSLKAGGTGYERIRRS